MRRSKTLRVSDTLHCSSDNENDCDPYSFAGNRVIGGNVQKEYYMDVSVNILVDPEEAEEADLQFVPAPVFSARVRDTGKVRAQKRKLGDVNSDSDDHTVQKSSSIQMMPALLPITTNMQEHKISHSCINTITKLKNKKKQISNDTVPKLPTSTIHTKMPSSSTLPVPVVHAKKPVSSVKRQKKTVIETNDLFTDSESEIISQKKTTASKKPKKAVFIFHPACISQFRVKPVLNVQYHKQEVYTVCNDTSRLLQKHGVMRQSAQRLEQLVPWKKVEKRDAIESMCDSSHNENIHDNVDITVDNSITEDLAHDMSGIVVRDQNISSTMNTRKVQNCVIYAQLLRYTPHTVYIYPAHVLYCKMTHITLYNMCIRRNRLSTRAKTNDLEIEVVSDTLDTSVQPPIEQIANDDDHVDSIITIDEPIDCPVTAISHNTDTIDSDNNTIDNTTIDNNNNNNTLNASNDEILTIINETQQEAMDCSDTMTDDTPSSASVKRDARNEESKNHTKSIQLYDQVVVRSEDVDSNNTSNHLYSLHNNATKEILESNMMECIWDALIDSSSDDDSDDSDDSNDSNDRNDRNDNTDNNKDDNNITNDTITTDTSNKDDTNNPSNCREQNTTTSTVVSIIENLSDLELLIHDEMRDIPTYKEDTSPHNTQQSIPDLEYEDSNTMHTKDVYNLEDKEDVSVDGDLDILCCDTVDHILEYQEQSILTAQTLYCGLTTRQTQIIEYIDKHTYSYFVSACMSLVTLSPGGGSMRGNVRDSILFSLKDKQIDTHHTVLTEMDCLDDASLEHPHGKYGQHCRGWSDFVFFHSPFSTSLHHSDIQKMQTYMLEYTSTLQQPQYHASAELKAMTMTRSSTYNNTQGQAPGVLLLHSVSKTEFSALLASLQQLQSRTLGEEETEIDAEYLHLLISTVYTLQYLQYMHTIQLCTQEEHVYPSFDSVHCCIVEHPQLLLLQKLDSSRYTLLCSQKHGLLESIKAILHYISQKEYKLPSICSTNQIYLEDGGWLGSLCTFLTGFLTLSVHNNRDIPLFCIVLDTEEQLQQVYQVIYQQLEKIGGDNFYKLIRWDMDTDILDSARYMLVHKDELAYFPSEVLSVCNLIYRNSNTPVCYLGAALVRVHIQPLMECASDSLVQEENMENFSFEEFLLYAAQRTEYVASDHTRLVEKYAVQPEYTEYGKQTLPCSYDQLCLLGSAADACIGPCLFTPNNVIKEDIVLTQDSCVVVCPWSQISNLKQRIVMAKTHFKSIYCILLNDQTDTMPIYTKLGIYYAADAVPLCHEVCLTNQEYSSWPDDSEEAIETTPCIQLQQQEALLTQHSQGVQGVIAHEQTQFPNILYSILQKERAAYQFTDLSTWQEHVDTLTILTHPLFPVVYNQSILISDVTGKNILQVLEMRPELAYTRQKDQHARIVKKDT